jgi:hypothetical protein
VDVITVETGGYAPVSALFSPDAAARTAKNAPTAPGPTKQSPDHTERNTMVGTNSPTGWLEPHDYHRAVLTYEDAYAAAEPLVLFPAATALNKTLDTMAPVIAAEALRILADRLTAEIWVAEMDGGTAPASNLPGLRHAAAMVAAFADEVAAGRKSDARGEVR